MKKLSKLLFRLYISTIDIALSAFFASVIMVCASSVYVILQILCEGYPQMPLRERAVYIVGIILLLVFAILIYVIGIRLLKKLSQEKKKNNS